MDPFNHPIGGQGFDGKSKAGKQKFHLRPCVWVVLGVLLGLATPLTRATVIYVNGNLNTDPVPDGLTWPTAFNSVQAGINAASQGDEVWVAAATYFENITLTNSVALFAGFKGDESDRSQRDWKKNLTILDGRQTNSVVTIESGATNMARIDGFVIRNGKAQMGGGIFCSDASPTIINNVIIQNQATSSGGGIRCFQSPAIIAFNLIQENFAASVGGGIECVASEATIENNRVIGNVLSRSGIIGAGAGVSCVASPPPDIRNNLILGNTTGSPASGWGGGIWVADDSSPRIINNTIVWNQAGFGGGIYCYSNHVTIANNIIAFGTSGVFASPGILLKNNCVFDNNARDFLAFPDPTGTNGNISANPLLVSSYPYPDIHLSPSSPCRDAGDSAEVQADWLDIDGSPRMDGGAVDIGADESSAVQPPFVPAVVRVSGSGDDTNDGSSWSKAKRTVRAGVEAATLSGGEVWVRAGAYQEQIALRHFVYLYGGFAGNETNRSQRDWKGNVTTLDGNLSGSVVSVTNLLQWNALDGFVIQNGLANVGAGIYCYGSSPRVENNTITGNLATNATRTANWSGGGIYCDYASPVISNNVISSNYAAIGGGIYSGFFSTPIIADNRLHDNVAITHPAMTGNSPYGGGGIFVAGNGNPTIRNNFFFHNVATNDPGAFQPASGGGICATVGTPPKIFNNTFLGNLASGSLSLYPENGGGIYCDVRFAVIVNNVIAFGSSGIRSAYIDAAQNARNNCVYGNVTNYMIMPDVTGTNGNISADPLLVSSNDFHLNAGSPCIDAGDDSVVEPGWLDLDGQVRRAGVHVDIGADEFGSSLPFALTLLESQGGGQTLLRLTGEAGRTYVFESSPDVTNWAPFTTNQATNATLDVSAPADTGPTQHFYRALTSP